MLNSRRATRGSELLPLRKEKQLGTRRKSPPIVDAVEEEKGSKSLTIGGRKCLSTHHCGSNSHLASDVISHRSEGEMVCVSTVAEEEATKRPTKSVSTVDRCYVWRKEERQILKNLSKYEIIDEKRE